MSLVARIRTPVARVKHRKWAGGLPCLIALAFGLLLRLILLYTTQDMGLMIVDEQHYHRLAHNLLHGHGFARAPDALTSMRPPLYPFFAALIWTITGTESLLYMRLAQIVLNLINVYLLYQLGLLLFDQRIALLAAVGFWLYPSFVACNFFLLTEILFTCLLTLVALGYVVLLRTGKGAIAWGTGCALGLAALTRSVLWPFPLVLCPLAFFSLGGSWKSRAPLVLYLLLGYALIIAPWAVRNTRLQGVFTLVDTMGGLNLLMGNYEHTPLNRAWDAISLRGEKSWFYDLPPTPSNGTTWTEGRKEKWALRKAVTYMLEHPALTLKRTVIKFANFWGLERVIISSWQRGLYQPPQWFAVMGTVAITLAYPLTMLLASLGLFLALPKNHLAHLFLVSVIVCICGVHTIVFGHERYHLPLMPFILLYAAAAIRQQSWQRLREGRLTITAPVVTCVLLLVIWGRELLFVETAHIRTLLRSFAD